MAKDKPAVKKKAKIEKDYSSGGETFVDNFSSVALKSDINLKLMAKSIEDFIYIIGADRKIIFVFGKYLPHMDKSCEKVIGSNYDVIGSRESVLVHRIAHENAFNGDTVTYEWFCESKKDKNFYRTALMPVFGKNNRVLSVIGSVKSVSRSIRNNSISMIADANRGIKSFSQILLTIREEEKKKISSVLHDELGSLAVALSSLLGILEADIKDNQVDNALDGLKKIKKYVDGFIERVKEIAVSLRPPNLDTVGLCGALKDLILLVSKYSDIKITFDCCIPDSIKIDEPIRIALYRITQEALNNILKHSGAKNAKIMLDVKSNNIHLTVSDDGIGFSFDKNKSVKLKNIGILAMKESTEFLGGKFELRSGKGEGSAIFVVCPLASYMMNI